MAEDSKSFAQHWEERQQWWDEFQPSKSLWLWSCMGSALITVLIGFFPGGWMTRDAAERMATEAALAARAELVGNLCAKTFAKDQDFYARLARFKDSDELMLSGVLEDGGLVTPASMDLAALAGICADKLADTKTPPVDISTSTEDSSG